MAAIVISTVELQRKLRGLDENTLKALAQEPGELGELASYEYNSKYVASKTPIKRRTLNAYGWVPKYFDP